MNLLTVADATREFGRGAALVRALNQVSMKVRRGEFAILQGPSGSGKTTLINLMGALDYPTSGKVVFDGATISDLSEVERDEVRRLQMGFVFQSVALISLMSAYENVEFGLRIANFEAGKRTARAKECLHLVGLQRRMDHRPSELSGGEQQRVAIARAIAHGPKVLFADEPTAELDTNTGLQVVRVFRSLIQDQGVTVVMSSHDPAIVDLGDRIIKLEDGAIVHE